MNRKGFSLIELLVVVAIIGILAAVGIVAYSGYTSAAKQNAILSQHKQLVKYAATEFQKCNLNFEYIFSTNSGQTSKCSVLSSGGGQGDPATDIGTAQKYKFKNIYDPKDGAGKVKLAFAKAAGNETNCTARDSGGDSGCHFIGWDSSKKILKIFSYYDGSNSPAKSFINFD